MVDTFFAPRVVDPNVASAPRSEKLAGTEGKGEFPGCPPLHQSPGGGSRAAAGCNAAISRLGAKRRDLVANGPMGLISSFILISGFTLYA
jgi:hypothetical protein